MDFVKDLKFTKDFWVIVLPCALMLLDIITGYYNAWKKKEVSSSKMRDGLGKKLAELVYIVVGILISSAFGVSTVKYFIALYIFYMEIVSIAENCKKLGVETPKEIPEEVKKEVLKKNSKKEK